MRSRFALFLLPLALTVASGAFASTINVGFVALDPASSVPGTEEFDITNDTGANSSPPGFPVTTAVSLLNLALTVTLSDSSVHTFTDFILAADNLSYVGADLFVVGATPSIASASLTGTFSTTTWTLSNGSSVTVLPNFNVLLTDPGEGDFALITASTVASAVPEPGMAAMLTASLGALVLFRRKRSA